MQFETLKEKCEYYRSLGERRLMPNGYVLMMLDGRSFSKLIKNKFEKPFDKKFINMMNETAKYLCENISGIKFAYVQSDEISLLIKDEPESGSFFGLRMTKLLSIAASLATGKFNQLMMLEKLSNEVSYGSVDFTKMYDTVTKTKLCEFDCKVWNVPNENDAYAWFLYRQLDCIRNSKQQTAQSWFSQKVLAGNSADKQIEMLKEQHNIDWNGFDDTVKYGRLIKKVDVEMKIDEKYVCDGVDTTIRSVWKEFPMPLLSESENREFIIGLINFKKE